MPVTENGAKDTSNLEESLQALIADAQRQPGVSEIMSIYEEWTDLDNETEPIRQAMEVSTTIYTSNSTSS